jgi:hypothetical protein
MLAKRNTTRPGHQWYTDAFPDYFYSSEDDALQAAKMAADIEDEIELNQWRTNLASLEKMKKDRDPRLSPDILTEMIKLYKQAIEARELFNDFVRRGLL